MKKQILPLLLSATSLFASVATAQTTEKVEAERPVSFATSTAPNCYDAADPNDIRLWPNDAPGATGNDPCRDIPFLRMYPASGKVETGGQSIVIVPGGGYSSLTNTKEQAPVAQYFSQTLGVTTFVLYYRLAPNYRYPVPMWDGQRAVKVVKSRAANLDISPLKVALFGFSAGGHLATTITLRPQYNFGVQAQDMIDGLDPRPNLLGLGYPVISMNPAQYAPPLSHNSLLGTYTGTDLKNLETYLSDQNQVNANLPPTFLFESLDDAQISSQNSVLFVNAVKAAHLPIDAHLFQHGVHGSGLSTGSPGKANGRQISETGCIIENWAIRLRDKPVRSACTHKREGRSVLSLVCITCRVDVHFHRAAAIHGSEFVIDGGTIPTV